MTRERTLNETMVHEMMRIKFGICRKADPNSLMRGGGIHIDTESDT